MGVDYLIIVIFGLIYSRIGIIIILKTNNIKHNKNIEKFIESIRNISEYDKDRIKQFNFITLISLIILIYLVVDVIINYYFK